MQMFEYKVIPAPNRPRRIKGVKGNPARFAQVLSETMNEMAAEGWTYLRADSLPVEEKPGLLKGRVETFHTVLVFQRPYEEGADDGDVAALLEDHSDEGEVAPEDEFFEEDYAADAHEPEAEVQEAELRDLPPPPPPPSHDFPGEPEVQADVELEEPPKT